MCGKNGYRQLTVKGRSGSPPRVREKLQLLIHWFVNTRITPACAGKTITPLTNRFSLWDHPRVCGKNPLFLLSLGKLPGSPPRVREKLQSAMQRMAQAGITPACAGKTLCQPCKHSCTRDHPRVCGKNVCCFQPCVRRRGSPPRVREKLTFLASFVFAFGITPACAGKTYEYINHYNFVWDHPRVCGKNPIV